MLVKLIKIYLNLPVRKITIMNFVQEIEKQIIKKVEYPKFNVGDTITVYYKIKEGEKERIQPFQGIVISRKGRQSTGTFTVRKVSEGIGIERIFPFSSPFINKIVVNKRGKVRRAKLFYLRERSGKSARIKEKRSTSRKKGD